MKAPGFWWRRADAPGLAARLLAPAAWIWRLGAGRRAARGRGERVGVPVLCIGNLVAGGAGKTPMTIALLTRLGERLIDVHVVSRGYGGRLRGPLRVDPAEHRAEDVGDEPLIMAAHGPVWVARDRAAGARAAAAAGAQLILLDDGYQNADLAKDGSILMVDAVAGFGNGRLIPAGPLREPVETGLARADLIVVVGAEEERATALERWPVLRDARTTGAEIRPLQTGVMLEGDRVFAFAGIGHPEKFFRMLAGMGANVVGTRAFPDHYEYPPAILRRLVGDALAANAMLVTTEKDAVRLPQAYRFEAMTMPVRLEPADWKPIDSLVDRLLAQD